MSPIYEPEAVKIQGNLKVAFVTTLADPTAPAATTEIKAASSVEGTLSMYGSFQPSYTINTGNAPRRIGTTVQLPQEGNAQLQPIAVTYPFDPSLPDTDENNKLKALLVEGTELYAVVRKGVDADTDWAASQRVEVWKVRCGKQVEPTPDTGDEFAEFSINQNLIPIVDKVEGTVAA